MAKAKRIEYFDLDRLCQGIDCLNCIHRYDEYGYEECIQDYKCQKIFKEVEYLLDAGRLENEGGFIDYAYSIINNTINDEFVAGIDLSTHPIWWVFFNGLKPIGMDSAEDILRQAFI